MVNISHTKEHRLWLTSRTRTYYYLNMHSNMQQIKRELDGDGLERCAWQCGVVGDPTKLKICYVLKYYPELCVGDIAELTGTSVSNVSHSLARLRAADLVKSRKEAQTVYYRLSDNTITQALLEFVK